MITILLTSCLLSLPVYIISNLKENSRGACQGVVGLLNCVSSLLDRWSSRRNTSYSSPAALRQLAKNRTACGRTTDLLNLRYGLYPPHRGDHLKKRHVCMASPPVGHLNRIIRAGRWNRATCRSKRLRINFPSLRHSSHQIRCNSSWRGIKGTEMT